MVLALVEAMRIRSIPVLVITVAGLVAFFGTALVRLGVRKDEAEVRAAAEQLAIESADSLATQFEKLSAVLQTTALQISEQGSTRSFRAVAASSLSTCPQGAAFFLVSKGHVVTAFPERSDQADFQGLPFEEWSQSVAVKVQIGQTMPLTAEGPFRTAGGGLVIAVRQPLLLGTNSHELSPSEDWILVGVPLESILRAVGLNRLSSLGFDYTLSVDGEDGRERQFLSSANTTLQEPVQRNLAFLQNKWTVAVAARDGRRGWGPIVLRGGLVLIFVLLAAILTNDLARTPADLRRQLEKLERRLRAASRKLMDETQQRTDLEKQFRHANFHDTLTGLPNRLYFMTCLERELKRTRRQPDYQIAVIVLNLDRFKNINDSLGYAAGDELIIQAIQRLVKCLQPSEPVVARLGGDEVALLLLGVSGPEAATAVADRLRAAFTDAFFLEGQRVFATASMGLAMSSTAYHSADELVRGADIALSKAKADGRARYELADAGARDQALSSQQLENDLRRAIEQDELRLNFQPIVSLKTGRVAGMEVLVRWHHPLEGLIMPGRFIPLAEETGLILPMNRKIMRMACRQAVMWRETLPKDLTFYLSVNVSAREMAEPDLCDFVAGVLQETKLPRGVIRAEVTESSLIGNVKLATELVSNLRDMGVPLLLDDFGMGYSSLSYLQLFKFDYLKIDMSFVRRITPNGENMGIIRAIVHMAADLGIQTIAEGIETTHVLEHLRKVGCDYGQGYYFSRPVEAEVAEQILRSKHTHPYAIELSVST